LTASHVSTAEAVEVQVTQALVETVATVAVELARFKIHMVVFTHETTVQITVLVKLTRKQTNQVEMPGQILAAAVAEDRTTSQITKVVKADQVSLFFGTQLLHAQRLLQRKLLVETQ
jgi:hypothetical protein